jgi:hypothetical protein
MATITFENGAVVNFDGSPTPQDVEEVAKSLGLSGSAEQTPPEQPKSFVDKFKESGRQTSIGIGKGLLETFKGMSSFGEKMLRGVTKTLVPKSVEKAMGIESPTSSIQTGAEALIPQSMTEADNGWQSFGKGIETVAEFLAPGAASTKVGKAITAAKSVPAVLKGATSLTGRMATEAALVGGQTAIKQGTLDDDAKTNALIAAAFPLAGKALSSLKAPAKTLSEKIQFSLLKPSLSDVKNGFKIENIVKHDIGGNVNEVMKKSSQKLSELGDKLRTTFSSPEYADKTIDLYSTLAKATEEAKKNASKTFGKSVNIEKGMNVIKDEIDNIYKETGGKVDLTNAQEVKKGAGTMGAWLDGMYDKESPGIAQAYDYFYTALKKELEDAIPNGMVKGLNKQMSEIIPVLSSAIRRMPVEQRREILSLTDNLAIVGSIFDPRALGFLGVKKLMSSGKFANFLQKAASTANESKTQVGKRIFGK